MVLTPAQNQIARDTHRFRVLNCGRRFGKTSLAAEEMLGIAISGNDKRIAYYAPTRDDARDIMWAILNKICDPVIVYKNEQRLELQVKTTKGGVSSIFLYGWEAVQERGKGRGVANDFIVLDEVASYRNFWTGWEEVLSPTLIDKAGSALFISTPKGFNHFYKLYNKQDEDSTYKSFHFTSYDNPHIPVEEIEREKASKTIDTFAQEYLAEFRKMEGLVYKEFDRNRHIFDDFTEYRVASKLVGVDFGYTNPAAVITIEKDHDSKYWVRYEWYKQGKTEEQIVEYAKSLNGNVYYPDPENASGIKLMEDSGLNVREVIKGKGSVAGGIDKVRELFKQNRLMIHKDCNNLISELETYRYPEPKEGKNEDENPIKEHDHALDALRYALMMDYGNVEDQLMPEFNLYAATYG